MEIINQNKAYFSFAKISFLLYYNYMKKQVVIIHGGDTFKNQKEYITDLKNMQIKKEKLFKHNWKDNLDKELGKKFEVLFPKMPNSYNSKYKEWKIYFENLQKILNQNPIFVGHSLGAIFLVKYFSENKTELNIKALFLIAPPFNENNQYYLENFKLNKQKITVLEEEIKNIYFYQSKDDKVVVLDDFKSYYKYFKKSKFRILNNRGHFNQNKIPELIKDIKKLK